MSDRLVSVIVPTYYRNERLREAVRSAYDQDWPVEVIVVDGSEVAHAEPVAEEFADRDLTYVPVERDEGPHAARSLGVEHARGEYVQFLDDDDRLLPGKFAAHVPLLSPEVGVVYSGLVDEEWGVVEPRSDVEGEVLAEALELRTFPCIPSTMLLDRALVESIHPFVHRHGADDSGMKIELARRTEFAAVDEPLVHRGAPDEQLSASWEHVDGRRYLLDHYADLYGEYPSSRAVAARQTSYRAGTKRLEETAWSARAIEAFARAAALTPEDELRYAAAAVASLFGSPGLALTDRLGLTP